MRITPEQAKNFLLGNLQLKRIVHKEGEPGVRTLINDLRHIQIDSLDKIGTNQDMVAFARVDNLTRGDVFKHLAAGFGVEHWAKERCIIPSYAFVEYYKHTHLRNQSVESSWWKTDERHSEIPAEITQQVLNFIRENGPINSRQLPDFGITKSKAGNNKKWSALALELLWTKCQIVSFRNKTREKLYDVPEKFLSKDLWSQISSISIKGFEMMPKLEEEEEEEEPPKKKSSKRTNKKIKKEEESDEEEEQVTLKKKPNTRSQKRGKQQDDEEEEKEANSSPIKRAKQEESDKILSAEEEIEHNKFVKWAILERVEAAGLLCFNTGPHWSTLAKFRKSPLLKELEDEGLLEVVEIEGKKRKYYAPKGFLERKYPDFDDRMRIIAPLDPIVWDRDLVDHIFNFDYVWEVYKKVHQRLWGYYVCPLLYKGDFVGRLEGELKDDKLVILRIWREKWAIDDWNEDAMMEALNRHAKCCGVSGVKLPEPLYADLEEKPKKKSKSKKSEKEEVEEEEEEKPKKKAVKKTEKKKSDKKRKSVE